MQGNTYFSCIRRSIMFSKENITEDAQDLRRSARHRPQLGPVETGPSFDFRMQLQRTETKAKLPDPGGRNSSVKHRR